MIICSICFLYGWIFSFEEFIECVWVYELTRLAYELNSDILTVKFNDGACPKRIMKYFYIYKVHNILPFSNG
jgi:hypothetical protein